MASASAAASSAPPADDDASRRRLGDNSEEEVNSGQSQSQADAAVQQYVYYETQLPCWLLALLAACLAAALAAGWHQYRQESGDLRGLTAAFGVAYPIDDHANPPARSLQVSAGELVARLGAANAELFARLDRDGNGLVSIVEYEALVHHVRQDAEHPVTRQVTGDSLYPRCQAAGDGGDSRCVQLIYRLTPPQPATAAAAFPSYLRLDPLSSSLATVANATGEGHGKPAQEVADALANFAATGGLDSVPVSVDSVTIATAFLPPAQPEQQQQPRLGMPYTLLGPSSARLQFFLAKQRRNHPGVYFEPAEVAMATLLRPLHPAMFLYPRNTLDRDSAVAVLRAESPSHLDIVFRLHPEMQLAPTLAPRSVYLTPPGLEGRLVLRRDDGSVELFQLGLPAEEGHLCQLESPHDIVETGQVALPHLSISLASSSSPAAAAAIASWNNWTAEVPMADALTSLRARVLPHLAARFHGNLSAAAAAAASEPEKSAIHVVVAFGGPQLACDSDCRALRDFAFANRLVRLRLRHYHVNAWINFADAAALAEFEHLTGLKPRPPLSCHLLNAKTLRPLLGEGGTGSFDSADLRKALTPPSGLPDPLPPTPQAVANGELQRQRQRSKRRLGGPLAGQTTNDGAGKEAAADDDEAPQTPAADAEPPEDPELRQMLEQQALDAIRKQTADAYMRFLQSSKA